MEQLFPDWNFEDNFHMSTSKRSVRPEDELVELLWRDGQVILQSQARREQPLQQVQTHKQETLRKPNNTFLDHQETLRKPNNACLEDQETVSWIQYPPEDVVDPFESEFSSHLFSSIDHLDGPEKPRAVQEETVKHETQSMAPPKFRSSVLTVGPSHCGSNQSTNNHQVTTLPVSMCDRNKNVEERLETSSGGSSGCSYGRNSKETGSGKSITVDRKRKHVMDTDQESVSQSDVRMISTDDQAMGNKSSQRSGSTRRSRAAEVHNLSERRRRDRINERMKALQELIPHCSKTDKASILDEAIDYLKSLQMQLQVMWMGNGMAAAAAAAAASPMMFPGVQSSPYMNQMGMQNQMQLPQFPVMNRPAAQNHPGLVCQNPVQFQIQAQNQILSEQLARYMGGFPQVPATTTQAAQVHVQQPMEMLRFGSPAGQQSQLSAPATTDSLRLANSVSTGERMKKRSPSVIVIGGGMAGISAARTLQDASFQVVVLESRDRIGGRVHTDYSFGFPVDLGASWLHGVCKENPLAAVIGRLGLPLYRTSGDNSVLYDHDLESYALFDKAGNQVPQELVTKVGENFEHILQEISKVRDEQVEDMSIAQAFSIVFKRSPELRLEGLAHNVLQWYLCRMEGWFAADAETISAKCWDQEELLPGGHGLMVRGYHPVINTLSKGLDIRLSHRVTKIARRYNGVKVTTEKGDTFVADAAVIALPLGVLKSGMIEFEPKLPQWKQEAINDLGVGIENKIILNFDNVFWPNVEFLGVVAETSYGCSYFLNLHKATSHPVLVYMPAGQLARDIEKMSDESAANFAFSQLQKILPDASSPIHYLVSRWGSDINTLGSYSYDIVNKPHDLYERLRVPLDNLFFAGEATSSSYPGSVHGAYSTGLLAAEDCRMRVLECYGELEHEVEEEASASVPLLISRM